MGSMTGSSFSLLPRSSQPYRAIGWAGLLAGSLDITAALVLAALEGKTPVYLFQAIAGGLLGMASFKGGLATALLRSFLSLSDCLYGCSSLLWSEPQAQIPGEARHSIRAALWSRRVRLHELLRVTAVRVSHENRSSTRGGTH